MNSSLELYERRAIAYLFDFLIATVIALALNTILIIQFEVISKLVFFNLVFILPFVTYTFINTLFTWITNGRTIGGLIFRLKIVHQDYQVSNKRLSLFTCFVRAICLAIYTIVVVNFFYMLVNKTTTAYFDSIAHTLVISSRK